MVLAYSNMMQYKRKPADHTVGAARHPADFAPAVFCAETLASSIGGAARHRARLRRDSAVFDTELRSSEQHGRWGRAILRVPERWWPRAL